MIRAAARLGIALACMSPAVASDALAQEMAVVTRHVIYPGQRVGADAITIVDASNCHNCDAGFITDSSVVTGKLAVRTLMPGRLIFSGDLRPAPAVLRGKEVQVFYRKGQLQISMSGIPLSEAVIGEAVSIRNETNGAIINGVVQADGTVMVGQ